MTVPVPDPDQSVDGSDDGPEHAPASTAGPRPRFGCLAAMFVFLACAILGFAVAASIRGDDDETKQFTLDEGEHDGVSYRLIGEIDEQGERCLLLERQDELNTGGCDTSVNEGRVGDKSIIFGQVPGGTVSVRVPLTNGDLAGAEVQEKDGFRWYSIVVEQEIDVEDDPTFVDADGGSL